MKRQQIDKDEFTKDVNNGMTIEELSIKYNCGTTTISRYKKRFDCLTQTNPRGRTVVKCETCGKEKGIQMTQYRCSDSKLFFCNDSCRATYFNKFRLGENHPNYREGIESYRTLAFRHFEHKCSICGYDIECCLEVHHIDENRSNNKIDNLIILCPNCHTEVHRGVKELLNII